MLRRIVPAAVLSALVLPLLPVVPASTAVAMTANSPLMGASTIDNASFETFNAQAGPLRARRTYNTALPASFSKSGMKTDPAHGRVSYWSFRPNPKTFATDKAAQAKFSTFLNTIPAGHKTVVFALHEPEDEIRAKKFTLAQWGATNNRVAELVRSKRRPELRFGISLMGPWTFDSRSPYYKYNWKSVINFKLLDVVGIDPYKFRATDPPLEQMLTKSNYGIGKAGVQSTMQVLSSWGKPIVLTEFGVNSVDRYTRKSISDSSRAAWIKAACSWMVSWNSKNRVKIEAAMYFQHSGGPYLTGTALKTYAAVTT
jgi:hypothetical protein